jgi:hypothetical protein
LLPWFGSDRRVGGWAHVRTLISALFFSSYLGSLSGNDEQNRAESSARRVRA